MEESEMRLGQRIRTSLPERLRRGFIRMVSVVVPLFLSIFVLGVPLQDVESCPDIGAPEKGTHH